MSENQTSVCPACAKKTVRGEEESYHAILDAGVN